MRAQSGLFDDVPVPLFLLEPDNGVIDAMNMAAQEWLSVSAKRARGLKMDMLVEDSGSLAEAITMASDMTSGQAQRISLKDHLISARNSKQRYTINIFPSGGLIAVLFLPLHSHSLQHDSALESAAGLGRMLAHEIKNPLAGIRGAAQLLRQDIETQEGRDLIGLICGETDRIRRLADRMERLGDMAEADFMPVNIHETLRRARLLFQSSLPGSIKLTEAYDPSLPSAIGNQDMLMQAIVNLIKNASEAIEKTKQSGEIKLETSYRSGMYRRMSGDADDAGLPIEIRIIDNGPGISGEVREHMFQPFVTDKPAGQGLGLALVSKIIAAHKGRIEVSSAPGHTVFLLRLPRP